MQRLTSGCSDIGLLNWFLKVFLFVFFFIILRTLVLFTPTHPIVGYFMIWIIYEICVFDATIMRVFN